MASTAISAQGTLLKIGGVTVGEVKNITGPSESAATIDVTSHSSPGYYQEFISGFLDGGEITLQGNLIVADAGQVAMHAALVARTLASFVLYFPTAVTATFTFDGIVTNFDPDFPFDGVMGFSATIKVSGQPVLAIGASAGVTACVITANSGAVTGVPTPWAVGTMEYSYVILTGEDWVTVTATFAAGTCVVTNSYDDGETSLTTTVESGHLTVGAADTITTLTITQTDPAETAQVYTVYIIRP